MKNYCTAFLLLLSLSPSSYAQRAHPGFLDGVVYLKVRDSSGVNLEHYTDIPELDSIIIKYGVYDIRKPFKTPDLEKIFRMHFRDTMSVDSLVASLQRFSFVEYAEKMPLYVVSYMPNDFLANQYNLTKINASSAWNYTTGSGSVVIAIVDNAVRLTHEDLRNNIWINPLEVANNGLDDDLDGYTDDVNGYDVADEDKNPNPPSKTTNTSPFVHGTHCAGIASASTDNGVGIASIGFRTKIMAVKCSPDTGAGDILTTPYEGLDYAISAKANIISMSWGGPQSSITGQSIIRAAHIRNIVLVGAAGNDNSPLAFYPAAYQYVISVGSTDQFDKKSNFSNYGTTVDVMAPGTSIYSTFAGSNTSYGYLSGTSMACPLVAGTAGLLLSYNKNLSPDNVETLLKNGCDNIDGSNSGYGGMLGAGRVNAGRSLSLTTSEVKGRITNSLSRLEIYPNPSGGKFFLQLRKNEGPIDITITNFLGQSVVHEKITDDRDFFVKEIDLSQLGSGTYYVRIVAGQKVLTQKVFIGR